MAWYIYEFILRGEKSNIEGFGGDFVTNKMIVNENVLDIRVKKRICFEINSTNIVTPKCWRLTHFDSIS